MGKTNRFLCLTFFLCLLVFAFMMPGYAEQSTVISGKNYVLPENSNFDYAGTDPTERFFYGKSSLGSLRLLGNIEKETEYNGYVAYGTNGDLFLQYAYDGSYSQSKEEEWHIESDGLRWIRDYDLGFLQNIAKGCIMIEKSPDAIHWEKAIEPQKNYFEKKKEDVESIVLTIPKSDYRNGMYYRIVVAYKLGKKTNSGYDHKKCAEVYEFYVASEENYVTFTELVSDLELKESTSTYTGFMIRKNGSQATVTVNGKPDACHDFAIFAEPGEYVFKIQTILGKEYSHSISVQEGMDFTPVQRTTYVSKQDKGFPIDEYTENTVYGSFLTSLSLATQKNTETTKASDKYGITGKSVYLFLQTNEELGSDWVLTDASANKVNGIETGKIGSGALIIQTSENGYDWVNVDKGRYAKGIYTTDYIRNYGNHENVLIYTPLGDEIRKGVYIRVLFAYQVKKTSQNEYHDYVETYKFYLCNNELGAVTFHNLSQTDKLEEQFAEIDQDTIAIYKQAESLESGDYTVTGFRIDDRLNPTVSHTVSRNGLLVKEYKGGYKFEETGRYDIKLTSAVGSTKDITIYVDRLEPEEAMKLYFGDGFITGKRIFAEGEYPVYEADEFKINIREVDSNTLPLYGQITNLSTGNVITIEQRHEEKQIPISEPGEYQAVFATSEKAFTGELTGDARVFTFHFRVIAHGTAPGPVVNRKMLEEYRHSTATDSNPVYFGLTYSSAGKGNITLAFASREAAAEYAYHYEKGTVEKQEDGSYRYTGSFIVNQKAKIDDAWKLTDDVNFYAEAAVQKHYFDMSDEFTYLSVADETIERNQNLRKLELPQSITIFGEGQKELLTDIEALPILNDKPYAYLDPETGEVIRGYNSFEFVTDQYGGIDSNSVSITDSSGRIHEIRYSESVGQQLLADKCASGIVTIHEETKYGDSADYQAVYIAPEENQSTLELTYSENGETGTYFYIGDSDGSEITAESFSISEFSDPWDLNAVVIVEHDQQEDMFTAQDDIDTTWKDPGTYRIKCLNRMGYGYTVVVNVTEPKVPSDQVVSTPEYTTIVTATPMPVSEETAADKQPDAPEETAEKAETNNTGNNTLVIIIIAGVLLMAVLGIFVYRRIRLFSRAAKNMKSGEENKDE